MWGKTHEKTDRNINEVFYKIAPLKKNTWIRRVLKF